MIELPSAIDIKDLIDDLTILSWEASDILLYYAKILNNSDSKDNIIRNENPDDPVTVADLKVNETIIKKIKEKYKHVDWEILSEENSKSDSHRFNKNNDWTWVLDPLDGTKDFIQGTKNYAMHLALNYKQRPYLGVVLIPEKDELWICNGEKVWCERRDKSKKKPFLLRNQSLQEMAIVTSKNHRNKILKNLINKISFKSVVVMGSIGCKIASILRGESDIYITLSIPGKSCPKDWDFAAPEAILRTAGGAITNLNNEELVYCKKNFEQGGIIIASNNSETHERKCKEIKEVIRKFDLLPIDS